MMNKPEATGMLAPKEPVKAKEEEKAVKEEPKRYYGADAVQQATKYYGFKGPISETARTIIEEEGFVPGVYADSKGIETEGVGQTKDMIGKNFFTEVLPEYERTASRNTKNFSSLPEKVQAAIVSMAYRGDWGPNTKANLKAGKWREAAAQYLDHDEFRKGRRKGATDAQVAIADRMERNARTLFEHADSTD